MTHNRRKKKFLLGILLLLSVVLVGLILAIKYGASVWLNSKRVEIEQVVSEATGTQARVHGTVSASLWPTPGISLGEVELTRNGKKVFTAREFTTSFELKPLFERQLDIHAIDIEQMNLALEANDRGLPKLKLQAMEPGTRSATRPDFRFSVPDRIELRNSDISVLSTDGIELYAVKGMNLAVHPARYDLSWSQIQSLLDDNAERDNWIATIHLNFEQAKLKQLRLGRSEFIANYRPDHVAVGITRASVFGGDATGTVSWIRKEKKPQVSATLVLNEFEASQSVTLFRPTSFINGKLNLVTNLTGSAASLDEFISDARGTVKLSGADLNLLSLNIDELVTRMINSKQYNLADAAAYFFIGPLGASATKGLDVANVARELMQPGETPNKLRRMTSSWNVANGIASARDVAMETGRYRLALKGNINLVKNEFDEVQIAVVDDNGCAIATQRIDGPIASPRIEKTNFLISLTRPMLDAMTRSALRLAAGNCEVFYKGELLPEKRDKSDPAEHAVDAQGGEKAQAGKQESGE